MTTSRSTAEASWIKALGRMRPWEVEAARDAIRDLPLNALGDLVKRLPAQINRVVPPGAGESAVEDIMRVAADVISVFQGREGVARLVAETKAADAPWRAFVAASQGKPWDDVAKILLAPATHARALRPPAGPTTSPGQIEADYQRVPAREEQLTASLVAAYVGGNTIAAADLPALIRSVHGALANVGGATEVAVDTSKEPAVSVRRSITPHYLVCLEDGQKFKSLKRHLRTKYNMSPEQYRARWDLPKDYPMVAPNYAQARSDMAKQMGLGQSNRDVKAKIGRRLKLVR